MTATLPSPTTFANTRPNTFAVGAVVRVRHNTNLFKIHSPAAWSDEDHRTPAFYNLTGPSGQIHRMVSVERLILREDSMGAAANPNREFYSLDGNPAPRVKHTHCWRCKSTLSHPITKVCPKCRGLLCECGGCRCNWPFTSP